MAAWNIVRVFISSTFRDMHAEREVLVKHVFPRIRKLCEERGIGFVDVDLRWGVTEEQAGRGEVLPICLAEIDRCRPYFIGLLGERYGWVPQEIPQELIDHQPWLAEHRQKSVTELEIVHGVLRNPAMVERASFYFRDPAYVEQVPVNQQADFVETDPVARQKLVALKENIRNSGLTWTEYRDAEVLGQIVLDDLTVAINQDFPPGQAPDALQREALEHEAFAQSRAGVYISRGEYFDRLDEHARGNDDGPGLVLLGESGSGKSALLANWAIRYRQEHPDELVLMHFIGASPYSTDWVAMLRRILQELKRRFSIEQNVPDQPEAVRSAFANWLHMAAARGQTVLVLDGVNQLEDRDGAPDLVWLPPMMPGNVRLMVSTLAGRPLEELTRRGWPMLTVEPFEPDERREFIGKYLAQFTKSLSPERRERIAASPMSANPLYLQALLEELRVFGAHEWLDERIDHYLAATTVEALYERILERYEADYEQDRPGLVRDVMTLFWAARQGLSESELLGLLGADDAPLAQAHWSPLYLAAERSLVSHSGLLGFFHDYLRQAVQNRYLPTEEKRHAAHLRLVDYFERQELTRRKIDELPWQLAEAGAWRRLYDLLANVSAFSSIWRVSGYEAKTYWARLEANSDLRATVAYRPMLDDPGSFAKDMVYNVARFLSHTGHLQEALVLHGHLVDRHRGGGALADLAACICEEALVLYTLGELDSAMQLHVEQEQIARELEDQHGIQSAVGNQGNIFFARSDYENAMARYREKERICQELGELDGLATALGNQASVLLSRGKLDQAMPLYEQQERMCRAQGDKDGLVRSLVGQGLVFVIGKKVDAAIPFYREGERICRDLGNKEDLEMCLGNLANAFSNQRKYDEALRVHAEEEQICRELGHKQGLWDCLSNQADAQRAIGKLEIAMALYREAERGYRELGNTERVATSLWDQAKLLAKDMKCPKEALGFAKQALRVASDNQLDHLIPKIQRTVSQIQRDSNSGPRS
jgi:tetratricopeptide (TPR) repeat protein